jgi:hypothetical protein
MLSHLCCFFNLLEFGEGSLKGKVIYRAPHQNQLKGLRQWINRNPFFVKSRKSEYEIVLFGAEDNPIDAACLSPATVVGLECSVLIEDEYQGIKKGSEMFLWMNESRAFLAKGDAETKRHIHASSGRVNTPFHDDYILLSNSDPDAVMVMDYTQCPWISKAHVQKERERNFMIPYFVEEQYECMWVLVTGHFFNQQKLHICDAPGQEDIPRLQNIQPTTAGVDFNGEDVGHVMTLCHYSKGLLVVFEEIIFQHIKDLVKWIIDHPSIQVEVEGLPKGKGRGDGYNAGFADHLQEFNIEGIMYQSWQESRVKQYRLSLIQNCEVYTYSHCKWFIKNFKEATYDDGKNKEGIPRLLKTTNQHGLDGVIHSVIGDGGIDIQDSVSDYYASRSDWNFTVDSIRF